MAPRDVLMYPDKRLREKCTLVEDIDEVKELIQDLKDTCRVYRAHGLAASQIGEARRIFVTHVLGAEPTVFINPEIVDTEDSGTKMKEGCLSFPGVDEIIERYGEITIKALNEDGEEFTLNLDGLEAVAVQHEYDHLDGILFIDHVSLFKRQYMLKKLKKLNKAPKAKVQKTKPLNRDKARKERKRQKRHRKSA
jgi:peptide deformylase